MNSIIKIYTKEEALDTSIVGQRLDEELIKCLKDNLDAYTKSARLLAPLFKTTSIA